jgi:cobalt-zinc-cadmium resistance protein CzcA
MTTLLAMLGLLPMAISTGMGSETQRPFALVLVGGMVTTCATALFLLPVVYSLFASERWEQPDEEEVAEPLPPASTRTVAEEPAAALAAFPAEEA